MQKATDAFVHACCNYNRNSHVPASASVHEDVEAALSCLTVFDLVLDLMNFVVKIMMGVFRLVLCKGESWNER